MVAGLEITSTERDGCCVLTVTGALDMLYARKLEVALAQHTTIKMPLVLDFSGLDFMDSSGLYVVLRTAHEFSDSGQRLILVPSPVVTALFEVAGVQHSLEICPDVDDALAALGASTARPETSSATES